MATKERTFPSPFSVPTPDGAEGWEELYPYYLRFREDGIHTTVTIRRQK